MFGRENLASEFFKTLLEDFF